MPASPRRPQPPGLRAAAPPAVMKLNAAQSAAVLHAQGPLLVLAGAGSGKTRVIIARIARLLAEGVPPKRILAVTFTNKAAREMRERLVKAAGKRALEVQLCTFHAFGLSFLREEHQAAGLKPHFAIYDTSDLMGVVRELCRQVQVAERRLDVQRLLDVLQATKRQGLAEVPIVWGDDYEMAAYDLYPRYLAQMRAFGAIDFDDLILRTTALLQDPSVQARWSGRFAHVLVDEYQDTSEDQLTLLRALVPPDGNIFAVGDDDQAIYAWRGASHDTMLAYRRAFPTTTQVILSDNYRSTKAILAAANAVIAHNQNRTEKVLVSCQGDGEPVEVVRLSTCEAEANFIAERIHALLGRGAAAHDIAVLVRANSQTRLLEETFRAERLPVRLVGGQSLFDRKETRDVLAFLRLLVVPHDEVALRRVVNVPPRGIGPSTLERLAAHAEQRGQSLWTALTRADEVPDLPAQGAQGARALVAALSSARAQLSMASSSSMQQAAEELVDTLALRASIDGANEAASVRQRRQDNVTSALSSLSRFEERHKAEGASAMDNLASFLRTQSLRDDDSDEEPKGLVHVMTVHAAKGLEFPYVFIVGLEEGLLPHRRSLDDAEAGGAESIGEERRLCYVAITRARRQLWLTYAKKRRKHGRAEPRTPSRFLQELPEGVVVREIDSDSFTERDEAKHEAAAENFFRTMRAKLGIDGPPVA